MKKINKQKHFTGTIVLNYLILIHGLSVKTGMVNRAVNAGVRRMRRIQGIRVGMMGMWGIRVTVQGIRVGIMGMRGIRVGMQVIRVGMIGMREIRARIWGIMGGNAGNRCGNAGNQSDNIHIGVEMMNEKCGEV